MRLRSYFSIPLLLIGSCLIARADNIVSNPNFSGPVGYGAIAGWSQTPYPSGTAGYPYLSGTDTQGGIFYNNGNSGTSTVGFIQTYPGTETNSLTQNLTLTPGQTYEFSFEENARSFTGQPNPLLTFDIGGVSLYSGLVMPVGDGNAFDLVSGSFVATSSNEALTFVVNSTGDATALLANVNVAAAASSVTPEPTSFALLGTGLLGVAGMVKRRFA